MMALTAIIQYILWQHNIWWHNPFRKECTPDFGCCCKSCRDYGKKQSLWKELKASRQYEKAVEADNKLYKENKHATV